MANFDGLMGELGQELRGIAEYWGIDLGLLVGLNLSYELRRVCWLCVCVCVVLNPRLNPSRNITRLCFFSRACIVIQHLQPCVQYRSCTTLHLQTCSR